MSRQKWRISQKIARNCFGRNSLNNEPIHAKFGMRSFRNAFFVPLNARHDRRKKNKLCRVRKKRQTCPQLDFKVHATGSPGPLTHGTYMSRFGEIHLRGRWIWPKYWSFFRPLLSYRILKQDSMIFFVQFSIRTPDALASAPKRRHRHCLTN